jgi:hypothetical protein
MMVTGTPREQNKPTSSGILENIENILTSGYGKKEDLRALDKTLRDQYYTELMDLRHLWEKAYLEVLEAGQTVIGQEFKEAIQTIDRLASTVNRADYGYAPLFDRVKKIQGESLKNILECDRGLAENLIHLGEEVGKIEATIKTSTWPMVSSLVDDLNHDLRMFEESWSKRKQALVNDSERR